MKKRDPYYSRNTLGVLWWTVDRPYSDWGSPRIARAWFIEADPPYRRSIVGVRVWVGETGISFGLCVRDRSISSDMEALHGRVVEREPRVIGKGWRSPYAPAQAGREYDQDSGSPGTADDAGPG